jgi:predicted P-loop ATPase
MIDFNVLNNTLESKSVEILHEICPGGKLIGQEYTASSKSGGQGNSFKYNIKKFTGSDFATGESFGDIISLYAAINNLEQIASASYLAERFCPQAIKQNTYHSDTKPNMIHTQYGQPAGTWVYHSKDGKPVMHIARYNLSKNRKMFLPWRFNGKEWECKAIESNRPLYKLPQILSSEVKIIICEGEKAADACQKIFGDSAVSTSWSSGAKSIGKTDFSTLKGKDVVIWPDADTSGIRAGEVLQDILLPIAKSLKIVDISSYKEKWDAADLLAEGITADDIIIKDIFKTDIIPAQSQLESCNKSQLWKQLNLEIGDNGKPHANADNVLRILSSMPSLVGKIWFDEFHNKIFTSWSVDGIDRIREWSDDENTGMMIFIQRFVGIPKIGKECVFDAIVYYSKKDIRNEPKDWMASLKWDGTSRINRFFHLSTSTEDSDYSRAVSKNFWISMVARVFKPGCKVDNMVILEGPQGKFKSTLLMEIGGKFFTEASADIRSVEFFKCLEGKIIVEFGELSSFSKSEVNHIKKIITCQSDRFRASYAKMPADHFRTCVFTGSTNDDEYLSDSTGGRRFWPLEIKEINLDVIKRFRDQLFAESVSRFKTGESWWEVPQTSHNEQEKRRIHDAWESEIYSYITNLKSKYFKVSDVAQHLGISIDKLDKSTQMRITKIIKMLKIATRRTMSVNDVDVKCWEKMSLDWK